MGLMVVSEADKGIKKRPTLHPMQLGPVLASNTHTPYGCSESAYAVGVGSIPTRAPCLFENRQLHRVYLHM